MTTSKSIYKSAAGEEAVKAFYDSVLARWPVPHQMISLPTTYGDTFVIVSGEPSLPPLVMLHGAGTNSAIWAEDMVEYTRHYHVFAIDLLGEPGKSAPTRPSWKSPAYEQWLAEVLAGLAVNKPTIVGISQGAWTALKYAVAHPDNIDKLVLICPGGIVPDRLSFAVRAILYTLVGPRGIKYMVHLLYADQPVPDGVEEITALLLSNFKGRMGVLPIFTNEELRGLTMPVLLIGGTKDALRDMSKIAARMRDLLPQLTVNIIPGAGHAVLSYTQSMLAFLNSQSAPVAA